MPSGASRGTTLPHSMHDADLLTPKSLRLSQDPTILSPAVTAKNEKTPEISRKVGI
jgi:hypothetical protein